jgi:AcrR family transcriptional regulator
MVMTPWGESDSLRERRLSPGPGRPREEVLANQRERLFGAMVASVSTRGYRATTVGDLAEISGVSSRTFYDLYADKEACLLATLEAIIEAAIAYAAQRAGQPVADPTPGGVTLPAEDEPGGSWEEQAGRGLRAFAEMIVAQPAAARLALVEAYTAGPEALVPLEQAIAGFEWLTRQVLERSPERVGMPAEMTMALMGAQQEIARNRLREGREAELPSLTDEIWELLLSYRPPPEPLRPERRRRARLELPEPHDHAERALQALAEVVVEVGYVNTTVDAVLKRARMSATTFYADFDGKDDAMLAAIDSACSQIVAAVMPAFRRAEDWPRGVRAAFGALFNFLAARPALANLAMVEVYAAGLEAMERRLLALRPLQELIGGGLALNSEVPRVTPEGILGGVYTLAYRRLRDDGAGALPALAPICTYITLSPFVGPDEACRIANNAERDHA